MTPALLPQPRVYHSSEEPIPRPDGACRLHPDLLSDRAICFRFGELGWEPEADPSLPPLTIVKGTQVAPAEVPAEAQGYALQIRERGLWACGRDRLGLLYALATLTQIARQCGNQWLELEIRDWPAFPMRYHHDDISRKQISTIDDFRRLFRQLGEYKITHYTLYLEDVLHLPSHPQIGEGRGKLMPEEVAALHDAADEAGIELFPTFTLMGHHENLLSLPRYRPLAADVPQWPSTLDPAKPEVREFLTAVIDDLAALFPSQWFHMGFDETHGVGRDGFLMHANWCAEQLVARGKTPVMWIDKLYGRFGMEMLDELHPAIIPVVWCYGADRIAETHADYFTASHEKRPGSWVLGGYNTWCRFLPDIAETTRQLTAWADTLEKTGGTVFGASQWGDHGYENHRDLGWPAFAAFADISWNGTQARTEDLPARFEKTFYGKEVPSVRPFCEPGREPFAIPGKSIWTWHRYPHLAMVRLMAADPGLAENARADLAKVEAHLAQLAREQGDIPRESGHLLHWESGLRRTRSVLERLLFAASRLPDPTAPFSEEASARCRQLVEDLQAVRALYLRSWLQNNRPENVEVSLAVFDEMIADLQQIEPVRHYHSIPLPSQGRAWKPEAGFCPIGEAMLAGVPYLFPDANSTHWEIGEGESVVLSVEPMAVHDLHLLAACPRPKGEGRVPMLKLELLCEGRVVYEEVLTAPDLLVDWHDVYRRDNTWAGGGLREADATRVDILRTVGRTSLCRISCFPFVGAMPVDTVRLTDLAPAGAQRARITALTLEKVCR